MNTSTRRAVIRALLNELKSVPCADCGNTFPSFVMDFDHRDPHDKTANLSAAWAGGWTRERVLEEAAKCDVVCANCHRIRTHGPANQEWVEELRVRQSAQLGVILGTD